MRDAKGERVAAALSQAVAGVVAAAAREKRELSARVRADGWQIAQEMAQRLAEACGALLVDRLMQATEEASADGGSDLTGVDAQDRAVPMAAVEGSSGV